jgi:hypothetical protein
MAGGNKLITKAMVLLLGHDTVTAAINTIKTVHSVG